jgi:D-alanyl-D-alanine dipeptidase
VIGPALLLLLAASPPQLVDAGRLVPDAVLDLRYASARNPAGRPLHGLTRCLLEPGAAGRLAEAAALLRSRGYRLLLWDCWRPRAVQEALWRLRPDPRWVADPARGSHHGRGVAVDLSLCAPDGQPLEMPTDHDAFDARARPDAERGVSPAARAHRQLLRQAMERAGFRQNRGEWWHYDAPGTRGPLLDGPDPEGAPR